MTTEFVKIAAAVPSVRPAAVGGNLAGMLKMVRVAEKRGVDAIVFPELSLAGATCGDMYRFPDLLREAERALETLVRECADSGILAVAGLPLRAGSLIFDAAAVVCGGRVLGVVPRVSIPGGRMFPVSRVFARFCANVDSVDVAGCRQVPFGTDLVFDLGVAKMSVAVGECALADARADVVLNPAAACEMAGACGYLKTMLSAESSRMNCARVFVSAGSGESTTDFVFGGRSFIYENGALVAEGEALSRDPVMTVADIDAGFLRFEKSSSQVAGVASAGREIRIGVRPGRESVAIDRVFDARPFAPSGEKELAGRCREVFSVQAAGLATRLSAIKCRNAVIGLSGGLDSALALLVCAEAFDILGLPRSGIHACTMPGFGTTSRTKGNAGVLAAALGTSFSTVDIRDTVKRHLADLGRDESVKDIVYENAQARARTYYLLDKANSLGAIDVGTGDMSEAALGWCTFNGDHISMYGVNSGVPKTLAREIVRWYASERANAKCAAALADIVETPVSPELLPADENGEIAQKTEDKVGPYELHDFFLYHRTRRGASPDKILMLAEKSFEGEYAAGTISKWLGVFLERFKTQQFKRNCSPDGPKTGTVGLSPRGDWTMPSDAG